MELILSDGSYTNITWTKFQSEMGHDSDYELYYTHWATFLVQVLGNRYRNIF